MKVNKKIGTQRTNFEVIKAWMTLSWPILINRFNGEISQEQADEEYRQAANVISKAPGWKG